MFAISIDTDWVIEPVIDDTLNILDDYKITATFFITNKINFNKLKNHELAIHPNLNSIVEQEKTLEETIQILPSKKTRGCRCHKLFHNSPLMKSYEKFGIEYDSNYYLPNQSIQPFFFGWADVLEIPIFASDMGYFFQHSKFNIENIQLNDDSIKVFLFHPIHIFMNTKNFEQYENIKSFSKDEEYLHSMRKINENGTRTLFIQLLEFIEKNKIETLPLEKINDIYRMDIRNK